MSYTVIYCLIVMGFFSAVPFSTDTAVIREAGQQDTGHIELIISNIKSNEGVVRIGMYTSEEGYPDIAAKSYVAKKDSLSDGKIRYKIQVNEPGSYGFSILDDVNDNGRMDYILGIIPKEGFGFSNNPKVSTRAPSYSETSFRYEKGIRKVEITMIYK